MLSNNLTFVLFMFNEEARVERAVKNLVPFGRVLVVDNYSTDRTVELAKSLGADVLMHKNTGWVEDEYTTGKVMAAVQTPWIYWGYADEMMDGRTLRKIVQEIDSGLYKIISIPRKNYFFARDCGRAYAGRLNRIFEKGAIDFKDNTIHYFGKPTVTKEQILGLDIKHYFVHHFISNTTKSYLQTNDRYTDLHASSYPAESMLVTFAKIGKTFLANYFVRGACKAGSAGLFFSIQTALYQVLLAMKAYEYRNQIDTPEIERRNNKIRDQILADMHDTPAGAAAQRAAEQPESAAR